MHVAIIDDPDVNGTTPVKYPLSVRALISVQRAQFVVASDERDVTYSTGDEEEEEEEKARGIEFEGTRDIDRISHRSWVITLDFSRREDLKWENLTSMYYTEMYFLCNDDPQSNTTKERYNNLLHNTEEGEVMSSFLQVSSGIVWKIIEAQQIMTEIYGRELKYIHADVILFAPLCSRFLYFIQSLLYL